MLNAGRRFGKSYLAINEIAKFARYPDKHIMYIAPSYRQARQIIWNDLKDRMISNRWLATKNENDLSIKLKNNSIIQLRGAENYDALRGVGLDFVIFDEMASINKDAWTKVIRPALADRKGHAFFTGTPAGIGNYFYELYSNAKVDKDWASWSFTTIEGGNVEPEELEAARRELDSRTFRQEFEASFETFDGIIYYNWDRSKHITEFRLPTPPILHIGMDFNVGIQAACVFVAHGDGLWAIDEIKLYNSNTHEMCQEIKNKYPRSRVIVYPDPASSQRRTSAMGRTDLSILQNEGFTVKVRRASIPVRDRINSVNSLLMNDMNKARLLVDPKCKMLIKGLERMSYKEGTNTVDLNNDYNHLIDAAGYCIEYQYPVTKDVTKNLSPARWAVPTRAY